MDIPGKIEYYFPVLIVKTYLSEALSMDPLFSPPGTPMSMPFECFAYPTRNEADLAVAEHTNYFSELIMPVEGRVRIRRGGMEYVLGPGELLFIPPLMPLSLDSADGKPFSLEVVRMDLAQLRETPSYSPDLTSAILEAEQRGLPMHLSAEETHETHIDFMISNCVREYREHAYGYDQVIRCMIYLIVTFMIRLWLRRGFEPRPVPVLSEPIYSITSYIDSHISEPLKVEDLAAHCGLSYPWFARRFREIYGTSCKAYIEKVRISKVEHYLLFTDCDLNYISRETGYADCSHMIKDFRRLRHMTPGQFRQAGRVDKVLDMQG